tara:strand:- start:386 stop:1585 length:1200 start_codon:yes stop_codon:yes gene_type:complete
MSELLNGSKQPGNLISLNLKMIEKLNIFFKPITELSISTRTFNGLKFLNITNIGSLVEQTENSLLRIPKFGKKALAEIKDILKSLSLNSGLNLHLGMVIDWSNINNPKIEDEGKKKEKANNFLKDNLKKLLLPIDKIEFSVRTLNCLKNLNIICLGDLVVCKGNELLRTPNFGKTSLNEIEDFLKTKSLYLGMEIPNWPPENYEKLVESYEISSDIKIDFQSLKEILDKKLNEREKIIYDLRLIKGKPLDFIGKNKFNTSRERVRQIEAKLFKKIQKYKIAFKKFLTSERNYIFLRLSNNSSLITYKTLKKYKNKNADLKTDKDSFIKFCILAVYKNKTNFLNDEYFPIKINEFIKRKTSKLSRIKEVQAWRKDEKIKESKKINSGVFKLYTKKGEINE